MTRQDLIFLWYLDARKSRVYQESKRQNMGRYQRINSHADTGEQRVLTAAEGASVAYTMVSCQLNGGAVISSMPVDCLSSSLQRLYSVGKILEFNRAV